MAQYTPNLGLIKPAGNDNVAIQQLNANMDVLDQQVHENTEKIDRTRIVYPPYIDENTGHWMIYDLDTGGYADSGYSAIGRPATFTARATTLPAGSDATASMSGTAENPVLNIGVPRGDTGATGPTGAAAGFGTPTASVDANVGTPSVTVTATGPDTAKKFNFVFKNLKGEKGDRGDGTVNTVNGQSPDSNGNVLLKAVHIATDIATAGYTHVKEAIQSLYTAVTTAFSGASSSAAGSMGMVPAPVKGDQNKFLMGNGTWETPTHQTIKQNGVTGATANRYATCSTAANTAAKTATIMTGTFTLEAGATVYVKFTNSNTATLPTLNVNGTGAKSIMRYGTTHAGTVAATSWEAGAVVPFTYDGTYWIMQSAWDNNTTYSNAALGQGYGTCTTEAATAAKVVTLSSYALIKGGVVSVKFTNSVPASGTMNINSKGAKAIFYKGAAITAGVIKAGDLATFIYDGTQYNLLSIDRWQDDLSHQSQQIGNVVLKGNTHSLSPGGTLNNTITLQGLTANHVVANWGLSVGTVSDPPADITITEAANAYTVVVSNVSVRFEFTPTFVLPQNLA